MGVLFSLRMAKSTTQVGIPFNQEMRLPNYGWPLTYGGREVDLVEPYVKKVLGMATKWT